MAVQPNPTPAQPTDSRKVVLVAEDDPFISRMYQIKLESAGLRVVVKANGREAYEAIKAAAPNLLLLDINMPELTGLELLSALASDNFDFSTMPIMVLTNSSNPEDKKTAQSYGADYLVKADYTPREVLDMIQQKLGITATPK